MFTGVLRQCTDAGLVGGDRLLVDATHVEADAALTVPKTVRDRPERDASNATARSRSDPDAKLRHKPGQRKHLVHRAQVAVDPLAADAGYSSAESYQQLDDLGVLGYVPAQPNAQHLAAIQARALMRTPAGVAAKIERTVHAEGAIAELKRHGLSRARSRGTRKLQLQMLAAATAINLKRLLAHDDHENAAGEPQNGACTRSVHPADTQSAVLSVAAWLLELLTATLNEIDRLAPFDTSTGS
ncbi:MAG: transposase [Solirubrobacteraceae bacterium]